MLLASKGIAAEVSRSRHSGGAPQGHRHRGAEPLFRLWDPGVRGKVWRELVNAECPLFVRPWASPLKLIHCPERKAPPFIREVIRLPGGTPRGGGLRVTTPPSDQACYSLLFSPSHQCGVAALEGLWAPRPCGRALKCGDCFFFILLCVPSVPKFLLLLF